CAPGSWSMTGNSCVGSARPLLARSWVAADGDVDLADAVDAAGNPAAPRNLSDPGWRAGEDQIAGLQLDRLAGEGDDVGDRPDHVFEPAVLLHDAIHGEPDAAGQRLSHG